MRFYLSRFRYKPAAVAAVLSILCVTTFASIFGSVRGVIHDPQHRPIQGAQIVLKAAHSDWIRTADSSNTGEFAFPSVPIGDYTVTVSSKGFRDMRQDLTVHSDASPILHFSLEVAAASESVEVFADPIEAAEDTVTPTAMVSRIDIQQTPGADRTNSLAMITDFVPGAYVTHDMLHMRGGHQTEWLIDGVPIPNTNIGANLGPQIDPKDIDYLEVQRGSYDADYGDRTYGIFNVVPRTGFERDRECDLVLTAGNFYQSDDQLSCGAHTTRSAYYASITGNRSDYGLQTPVPQVVHDAANGFGGLGSFILNADSQNQYRIVGSLRRDYYQIPIDPNPNSVTNSVYPSYGLHDAEREPDGYIAFSWVHTFNPDALLTVSPFYHYNGADYTGGPNDFPVISTVTQTAQYYGAQVAFNGDFHGNDLQTGFYGFGQHQFNYFFNQYTDGTQNVPASNNTVNGSELAVFVNDKYAITPWLTLIAGVRETAFNAAISEHATDPRLGASIRIPRVNVVFHGFYGYFYQAPPLSTATSQLQTLAAGQGFAFAPLHGERDIEWQYGATVPYAGWMLSADNFETRAENWLDHNNIGESNIFWPITWNYALIQGWEFTLRSPNIAHRGQLHVAYSNQIAQATSPITGGLVFNIPPGLSPVDHDQRNTLNVGFNGTLPHNTNASANVYYGSGFLNGQPGLQYPGMYLPSHTTVDLSVGKSIGERVSLALTGINVANRRVQLDNSLTFGGFHWDDPRQIYLELRYRFKY